MMDTEGHRFIEMNYLGKFLGRILGGVITICLLGVAISLAISNPDEMIIKLWPLNHQLTLPVWLVVLASFAMGLIIGGLAMLGSVFALKMNQFNLKRNLKALEKEKLELSNKVSEHSKNSSQQSLLGAREPASNKSGR